MMRVVADTGIAYLTPEARARLEIDRMLEAAAWVVQDASRVNLSATRGVPLTGTQGISAPLAGCPDGHFMRFGNSGELAGTRLVRLPCRRSRVRVPSSASQKALETGLFWCQNRCVTRRLQPKLQPK
jgi:hypothetical protein